MGSVASAISLRCFLTPCPRAFPTSQPPSPAGSAAAWSLGRDLPGAPALLAGRLHNNTVAISPNPWRSEDVQAGRNMLSATGPGAPRPVWQSFLCSRCYTLFLWKPGAIVFLLRGLSSVSLGIQLRTGGRSQIRTNMNMKQFPLGRKKRPISLTKGSVYAFSSNC